MLDQPAAAHPAELQRPRRRAVKAGNPMGIGRAFAATASGTGLEAYPLEARAAPWFAPGSRAVGALTARGRPGASTMRRAGAQQHPSRGLIATGFGGHLHEVLMTVRVAHRPSAPGPPSFSGRRQALSAQPERAIRVHRTVRIASSNSWLHLAIETHCYRMAQPRFRAKRSVIPHRARRCSHPLRVAKSFASRALAARDCDRIRAAVAALRTRSIAAARARSCGLHARPLRSSPPAVGAECCPGDDPDGVR